MGYFTRRLLINIWCIFCIGIMVLISFLFDFTTMGLIIGGIIAFLLFFSTQIINLIKKKTTSSKIQQLICPRCMIAVDKETGICPKCGNKL